MLAFANLLQPGVSGLPVRPHQEWGDNDGIIAVPSVWSLMKHAALGLRAHSGWTALVAVSLEKDGPRILVRQRPKLVETFTYEFRQPYHSAEKMSLDKAREFIFRVESEAQRLAVEAIRPIRAGLRREGYELTCLALPLASARALPDLATVLSSHALIHSADGELFRRALIQGGKRCHVPALTFKERELFSVACQTLRIKDDELRVLLTALGRPMGSPWSQDEKIAALAAWLALYFPRTRHRGAIPGTQYPS